MNQVSHSQEGYRRGIVLGLTLAEVMLLLLFCLLLAAGVLLEKATERRKTLEAEVTRLSGEAKDKLLYSQIPADLLKQLGELLGAGVSADVIAELLSASAGHEIPKKTLVAFSISKLELEKLLIALTNLQNERQAKKMDPLSTAQIVRILKASRNLSSKSEIPNDWQKLQRLADELGGLDLHPGDPLQAVKQLAALNHNSTVKLKTALADPKAHEIVAVTPGGPGDHRWPPIIRMSEADGYFFRLGSAELTDDFKQKLSSIIIPQVLDRINEFNVDVIEVIGHTDEVPLKQGLVSNLDQSLMSVFQGQLPAAQLVASDNAGLGLARASVVVELLKSDPRLSGYRILPLSAAQLTNVDETLSVGAGKANVKERRRVEIRTRRHLPPGQSGEGN